MRKGQRTKSREQIAKSKEQRTTNRWGKGLVYVFTGEGKGKTSAALGVGVRAALSGMKVAMVCWYKEARWPISELGLPKRIPNFKIFLAGKGFYIQDSRFKMQDSRIKKAPLLGGGQAVDDDSLDEHQKAARAALEKARELLQKVDILILDEVNNAIKDGLVDLNDVIDLLTHRGKTHLVLTGRGADRKIISMADLVTEMKKVKHPFDLGQKAVKGLDF